MKTADQSKSSNRRPKSVRLTAIDTTSLSFPLEAEVPSTASLQSQTNNASAVSIEHRSEVPLSAAVQPGVDRLKVISAPQLSGATSSPDSADTAAAPVKAKSSIFHKIGKGMKKRLTKAQEALEKLPSSSGILESLRNLGNSVGGKSAIKELTLADIRAIIDKLSPFDLFVTYHTSFDPILCR